MVIVKHKLGFDFHSEQNFKHKGIPQKQVIAIYDPVKQNYEEVTKAVLQEVQKWKILTD